MQRLLTSGACAAALSWAWAAGAVILWSDLGQTLVRDTGPGTDILGGVVKRNDTATDVLYFKFHVNPLSDGSTEEYFAGFQLFEGDNERLGVGNSTQAWAYSAFNTSSRGESNKVFGDVDLHSAQPEPSSVGVYLPYQVPRRGIECTIVFKVQYVAGGDDLITVWVNPDLSASATEPSQPESLTTKFSANASFDQIRLRHGGPGGGWTFSDMAIATSFSDFRGSGTQGVGAKGAGLAVTFRVWQREQGLPQNRVRALAQTRDGYIWIGSDSGVARFDGVRFVSFGLREGLRSGAVEALLEDTSGSLWVGTRGGGLARLRQGRIDSFTIQNELPSDSITALAEDRQGRLWVGTEAGLALWQDGHASSTDIGAAFKGRLITTLYKDRQGTMWLGAKGVGVFYFADGKLSQLTDATADPLLQDAHCLLMDKADRLWIGAGDDYVLCREGGQFRRYEITRHLARPYVCALVEEADGTVWAGSVSEGLFQFSGGKVTPVTAGNGLSDNAVESLLIDREGDLWAGTGGGLNRLRRNNLTFFGQNPMDGLGYGPVQGLAEVAPGVIWACKPSDGLYRYQGRGFGRFTNAEISQLPAQVNTTLVGRDGIRWVGAVNGLLGIIDTGNGTNVAKVEKVLAGMNVISLVDDPNNGLWVGTRENGLWHQQSGKWLMDTNFSTGHAITAMALGPDGSMLIGTEGAGLFRIKGGVVVNLNRTNGLPTDLIRSLYVDSQGAVWIGTAGGGLCLWRDGHATTFTTRDGLPDNTISQILEDEVGRLWLGSNWGIGCVGKSDLEELASGKVTTVYPQIHGREEGMLSEECTGGFWPAGLKTRDGLLWFPTLKGIAVVDSRPNSARAPAPGVVIEETLIDGAPAEARGTVNLSQDHFAHIANGTVSGQHEEAEVRVPPGKHRLEFHYTGLSFTEPERVRFRYKLEGLDNSWVEGETRRLAPYGYVPPGNYQFRVIACNGDGVWNQEGASMSVVVLPHFWQVSWFLWLSAVVLAVAIAGTARIVEQRKLHRRLLYLEKERALEHERARIAQDLHDDLGSSLARISLLSGLTKADRNDPAQVEAHADKISQSADQTVRALEEIVWAVRPGSDSLQSLVEYIAHFANEFFDGHATRCRLDLPHDLPDPPLPPDMRHNIFLVVKEALTNALKHASAKEVQVHTKVAGSLLEILVQDDGKGFDSKAPVTDPKRNGLGNMRRRAEAIGGVMTVESSPGRGTRVSLNVRLPARA